MMTCTALVSDPHRVVCDVSGRYVIAGWDLHDADNDTAGDADASWPQVVLLVRHDKGVGYRATLATTDVGDMVDVATREPFDSSASTVVLTTRSIARYSERRRQLAYTEALATFRRLAATDDTTASSLPSRETDDATARDPRAKSAHGIVPSFVGNLTDGDIFSVDGGMTWYVCAIPGFDTVVVYTSVRRDDDAPTLRVNADDDGPCLIIVS